MDSWTKEEVTMTKSEFEKDISNSYNAGYRDALTKWISQFKYLIRKMEVEYDNIQNMLDK